MSSPLEYQKTQNYKYKQVKPCNPNLPSPIANIRYVLPSYKLNRINPIKYKGISQPNNTKIRLAKAKRIVFFVDIENKLVYHGRNRISN